MYRSCLHDLCRHLLSPGLCILVFRRLHGHPTGYRPCTASGPMATFSECGPLPMACKAFLFGLPLRPGSDHSSPRVSVRTSCRNGFKNPTPGSGSHEPAAPSCSTVTDLQKITAPKTPPKNPGPKGPPQFVSNMATISEDDEQLFQATQRSSYDQLRTDSTASQRPQCCGLL